MRARPTASIRRRFAVLALIALAVTTVGALPSPEAAIAQTPGVPGAPSITSVTVGSFQLTPNWAPPADTGSSAITDYEVRYRAGTSGDWSSGFDHSYDSGTQTASEVTWSHDQDPLDLGSPTGDVANLIERTAFKGENGLYKIKQALHRLRVRVEGEAHTPATIRLMHSTAKPTDLRYSGTELTRTDTSGDHHSFSLIGLTSDLPADSWFWIDGYDRSQTGDGLALTAITVSDWRLRLDVSTISASTRRATVEVPTNSVSYQVQVRAKNGAGWGPWSDPASATPVGAPHSPTGLRLESGASKLTARWSPPANNGGSAITDYDIQYHQHPSGNWIDWQTSTVSTATTATITGLTDGANYHVRVRATNAHGDSDWTPTLTEETVGKPSPPTITLSTVRRPLPPGKSDTGGLLSITLSAADNGSAITDYDLRYRAAGTTTWYPFRDRSHDSGKLTTNEASGTADPIDFGTFTSPPGGVAVTRESIGTGANTKHGLYKFSKAVDRLWIRASGTITGGGTVAARWHTTAPTASTLATAGTQIFSAATESDHTFWQDGWVADLPANAYVWLYTSAAETLTERRLQLDFTENRAGGAMVLSGLHNGTTYELQARAKNARGKGSWASASGTSGTPVRPVVETPTAKHQALQVTWAEPLSDNGSTVTGYGLRYRARSSGPWTAWPHATTAVTTRITGLVDDTEYEVQVRARNGHGNGFWSTSVTGTPEPQAPDAPDAPTLTAGDHKVIVDWSPPADNGSAISDYDVRHCSADCDREDSWTSLPDTTDSTALPVVIGGLTVGTTYRVQVRAQNSLGTGPWSVTSTLTLDVSPAPALGLPACDPAGITQLWVDYACYVKAGERGIKQFDTVTVLGSGGDYIEKSEYPAAGLVQLLAYNPQGGLAVVETSLNGVVQDVFLIDVIRFGIRGYSIAHAGSTADLTVQLHSPTHSSPDIYRKNGTDYARSWVQLSLPQSLRGATHDGDNPVGGWVQDPIQVVGQHGDTVTFRLLVLSHGTYTITINARRPAPSATCPTQGPLVCFNPPEPQTQISYTTQMSASATFQSGTVTPPAAPTGLSAAAGDEGVTLSWDDPSDRLITGYEYQARWTGVAWQPWTPISDSDASTTAQTITGLANGTEYRFRLRAVNAAGTGTVAPSADPWYVAATPQTAPTVPPATPSSVTVTRTDGALTATWPTVDGATSYHITYTSNNGTNWQLAALNHTDNTITIDNADNNATYIVGVRARNSAGGSNWRNSPAAGPYVPPTPPAAPTGVTATAEDSSVTLAWDDPSDSTITGYEYQLRWTGVAWSQWTAIPNGGASTTSYTVDGLTNGIEYRFRLRAVNAVGTGAVAPSADPWYVAATPQAPQ